MKEELLKKIVSREESMPDNLIVGTDPATRIGSAVLRKGTGILKRGTVLAKSSTDSLLVMLGTEPDTTEVEGSATTEMLEAYGILTDDVDISEDDVPTTIYIGGLFNANRIIVADDYTMTETDKDTLRKYGIEFKAAFTN